MQRLVIIVLYCFFLVSCKKDSDSIDFTDTATYLKYGTNKTSNTGFIFYPGALIEARAYNGWHKELALNGINVFSVKFPAGLAILNVNAALKIITQNKDITNWYIGGHSLGGAMAIQLLEEDTNLALFDGLILCGAYPGGTSNLSNSEIRVLSLYASQDEISSVEEINEGRSRLPMGIDVNEISQLGLSINTFYYLIEGGNHSYFGKYGHQQGDGTATITREEQQKKLVEFTTAFIFQ